MLKHVEPVSKQIYFIRKLVLFNESLVDHFWLAYGACFRCWIQTTTSPNHHLDQRYLTKVGLLQEVSISLVMYLDT